MSKRILKRSAPVFIAAAGIAFAFAMIAMPPLASHVDVLAAPVSQAGLAAPYQITPTPTPEGISHPGSTDGIMLMGVVIVIIILLPIVFHRNTWTK